MSILIKGLTAKELLDVFEWARTGANNCMVGHGVIATELPDHGDLIDRDNLIYELGEDEDLSTYHTLLYAPVVIPAERREE